MKNGDIHVHKRSTRADPLVVLVGLVVALTLLPTLLNAATAACRALGLQTELPLLVLRLVAWGVLAACGVPPVRQLLKTFAAVSRRSKALRDLPGPSYGILGILPLLWRQKDIHRQLTKWADEFGPIYRVRIAVFHVSGCCSIWCLPRGSCAELTCNLILFAGSRGHRPCSGLCNRAQQGHRQVPLHVPLHGRGTRPV